MKVAVLTLGCKVNQYESDSLVFELQKRGIESTNKLEWADAYIINTCAVTNEAESKSRQMIERARKLNSEAKFFVVGCASQHNKKQFEDRGASFVLGTSRKLQILDEIEKLRSENENKQKVENVNFSTDLFDLPLEYDDSMTATQLEERVFIKIQEGCNKFCTYCIIPYLRGRSRSRSIESIVGEVEKLPETVKEIVLVGIDIADFRVDGKPALAQLLQRLDVFGKRLRLSSMEENLIDEEFLHVLSSLKNFCPHFHLSLQSGSDEVLKKMNRKYLTADFEKSVKNIRKVFPLAGITTDIIVGFPTETEAQFEETLAFAEKISFSQVHIFPYSKREGTVAAKMFTDLPKSVKSERAKRLKMVADVSQRKFIEKNTSGRVLIEESDGKCGVGYTENYIRTQVEGAVHAGDIVDVKIYGQKNGVALAKLVEKC